MGTAWMLQGREQVMLLAITFSGLWLTAKVFGKEGDKTAKTYEYKTAASESFHRWSKAS
jgi:hypothetical protein